MSKYLLGTTTDKELVFGEFKVTTRNGYPEFTACFDTVKPFKKDDIDAEEYYENLIDEMDDTWVLEQLKCYDCQYSELAENMADESDDIQDIKDCSTYPEIIEIDDTEWYFESMAGGQHDTRADMDIIINEKAYNKIHELWDKYHLCKIDESIIEEVNNLQEELQSFDEQAWITDYIENNF